MDNNADEFLKALFEIIPKSLDEIIRHNRDFAQLRITTDIEIMKLYAPLTQVRVKEVINDWRFISLVLQYNDKTLNQVHLLGDKDSNGLPRITSIVRKIDLDRQLIYTNSGSLYQLGSPGSGEPNQSQLYLICAAFNNWGIGKEFEILPIFY